jgi:flavin-dependent dehydrogenase
MSSYYDAIVVGARVAGAATALLLARAQRRVLVIDRGRYGADTLSTHALMRGAVRQLSRWNVLSVVQAAGTPPIRLTTFHYGDDAVQIPIKPREGVPALYAPRRHLLDRILVDAAAAAGAEVRYGVTLDHLTHTVSGRVNGVVARHGDGELTARSPIVIGADGVRSTMARLVDARIYRQGGHAAAVVYGYWPRAVIEGTHWYWRDSLAAGAIPTNAGETCVFVAVAAAQFAARSERQLTKWYRETLQACAPDLSQQLPSDFSPTLHGFGGLPGFFRQSWGPGWALVGDAGYFRDPITAHGITDALRDAETLAAAVIAGQDAALARYQCERDIAAEGVFELSDAIASFNWNLTTLNGLHHQLSEEMNGDRRTARTA